MRGTRFMSGLVALLGLIGTASGGSITQVSYSCGPEKCCEPVAGCQPRKCRPACMHSKFWRDLGNKCCGSDRGCCKQDCCGKGCPDKCCAPLACNNGCGPKQGCCPMPKNSGCCPAPGAKGCCSMSSLKSRLKACCTHKPSCTPNKGCCSVKDPCCTKGCTPTARCCPPKACHEDKGVCSVRAPKQVCCKEKPCKEKGCKECRKRFCPDDCGQIAHLIYVSQTGCSAKIRGKALDRLGDKYSCTCHPEIMCAFVYGLNDIDANVRWHAADEIGDQIERHGCCCINQNVIDSLIVTLSDCHPKVIHQAEEALQAAGYDLRECYRECGQNDSYSNCNSLGCASVRTGSASSKGTVTLGTPETAAASARKTPSVTPNAAPELAPVTTSVSVEVRQAATTTKTVSKPAESSGAGLDGDNESPVPGPMPEANPNTVDPETYFPTRLPDQQSRNGKHRSQLANLFGLR